MVSTRSMCGIKIYDKVNKHTCDILMKGVFMQNTYRIALLKILLKAQLITPEEYEQLAS